jgi:beta-lactamase superfamily II metal-dependent hydrolase
MSRLRHAARAGASSFEACTFTENGDMRIEYVKGNTAKLFSAKTGDSWKAELLWGDRVQVLDDTGSRYRVKARGRFGWVRAADLVKQGSLLEFYFIDVGQGDGVLIRTPNHRHILIDGGWPRRSQPIGKNAADFVDWKFVKDYGEKQIDLDAMICSHNDQDHYGGLWDLLNPSQKDELDAEGVSVEHFYHAGLSWWTRRGGRTLGPSTSTPVGALFTRLLDDRDSLVAALKSNASPKLQGEWASFLRKVRDARTRAGDPTPVTRLSHQFGFLPGFEPSAREPTIHVLGPVEFDVSGQPAIRKFSGGDSKNTNGNSVLLRVDYKQVRILLTGDLNMASQQSLLADWERQHDVFACDVAKACHHGSGDVSLSFLEKMRPAVTVISSGDSEGHDHPRPNIVAASGLTGFKTVRGDRLVTPLVYSTELARSVGIGHPSKIEQRGANDQVVKSYGRRDFTKLRVTYRSVKAGNRGATTSTRRFDYAKLAVDLIFGLINVRTDGKKVLCAALNEKSATWNVETFTARF